jgi:hypothetical protein
MLYDSLILTKETLIKNYTDKFMNKHSSTLYPNKDFNEFANKDVADNSKTNNGVSISKDSNRVYSFSIDTQYNPCLIKLLSGDIAMLYTMYVDGNSQQTGHFIITADIANQKCKEMFGDGSDKTIDKDWNKVYHDSDKTEEITSTIITDPAQKITGSPNLTRINGSNKINIIKLLANRPNPTTDNLPAEDFVERWN